MPAPFATATMSVEPAVAVGCLPVIWWMPLSQMMMVRLRGATLPMVARQPSDIRIEPSPSSAMTPRSGCASATPSAIGQASPMLPSM